MNISYANGYRSRVPAEVAYDALEKIRAKNNGTLSPEQVANAAKPKNHPLHNEIYRESQAEAASLWWIDRARTLIRAVIVEDPDVGACRRKYECVVKQLSEETSERVYLTTEDIMANPVQRAQLLTRAIKELSSFRRRYRTLSELAKIHDAIDDTLENVG